MVGTVVAAPALGPDEVSTVTPSLARSWVASRAPASPTRTTEAAARVPDENSPIGADRYSGSGSPSPSSRSSSSTSRKRAPSRWPVS